VCSSAELDDLKHVEPPATLRLRHPPVREIEDGICSSLCHADNFDFGELDSGGSPLRLTQVPGSRTPMNREVT
jgi:hypothetical protein